MSPSTVKIAPIPGLKVTPAHLIGAMLSDLGCHVGGVDGVNKGTAYSRDWEWFDPFKVTDPDDLPEHWQQILKNQNSECWREGYRYVHAPEAILCSYPDVPVRGIFAVTNDNATPETVTANDLIHIGGLCTEYDTEDKGIWQDWIEEAADVA